jgi:hypothetical protein
MRLVLLGFIFLLILTLGNAWLLKREQAQVRGRDYAPLQLVKHKATHYEWDAFVWREIAALAITVVIFGAIASTGRGAR